MSGGSGWVWRLALRFTGWTERYLPDAFVFAVLATVFIFVLGLVAGDAAPLELVGKWGDGFWELLPFTLQMALVIITGYVLATARPVHRLIARLARVPKTARTATLLVGIFAMLRSPV